MSPNKPFLAWIIAVACLLVFSSSGRADVKLRCLQRRPTLNPDAIYGYYPTAWHPWPIALDGPVAPPTPEQPPAAEPPMPYATSAAPVPAPLSRVAGYSVPSPAKEAPPQVLPLQKPTAEPR